MFYSVCYRYTFGDLPLNALEISDNTNNTIKMKNIILAMPVAAPAMPPKPNTAAMIAIIKKVIAQPNIVISSRLLKFKILRLTICDNCANLKRKLK